MEIMRKVLFASVLLSVFCCGTNSYAGSNDDITNACYVTKKCGVKDSIQVMTVIPFTVAGSVLGGAGGLALGTATPWAAGPGVGFVLGGVAGGYGGYLVGNQLGGYLAKSYNANEYLYFNDGTCLECDTHQMGEHFECPNGTIASNGSYFYRCRTETFGDSWEEYRPLPCRNSPIQDTTVKGAMYEIKATVDKRVNTGVYVYSGDMCLYISCGDGVLDKETNSCVPKDNGGNDDKKSECAEYISDSNLFRQCSFCHREKESGAFWDSKSKICRCIGEVNKEWNAEQGKCVNKGGNEDDVSECADYMSDYYLYRQCAFCKAEKENGAFWDDKSKICRCIGEANKDKEWNTEIGECVAKGGGDDVNTCLAKRTTAEGKACCYLAESVAKFENGKCVCSGGKTFSIDDKGKGSCTGGNGDDEGDDLIPVTQCVTVLNELSLFVKTNCVSLSTKVESLMELCMSGYLTVAMWNSQSSVIRNSCLNQQESPKQKLVAAAEKLDTIFAGFKVSKWKNEEGKFNTARLASDSIAGVVLGTTGGLITSSVMKKKQVEQGFEDLQCVVGGQPVAGWGDEFMVGIQ